VGVVCVVVDFGIHNFFAFGGHSLYTLTFCTSPCKQCPDEFKFFKKIPELSEEGIIYDTMKDLLIAS
jgi:hypothetical protein